MDQEANRRVAEFWTDNNVTQHRTFRSKDESLEMLRWRNDQYLGFVELMPFSAEPGQTVLDYGCGPGHDLVGYITESNASRIIGADVSSSSLSEAAARCRLHERDVELIHLSPDQVEIPLEKESVDVIHSSGVIHHIPDPVPVLRELRRILKPGGVMRCMNYNRESLFYHCYVGWQKRFSETGPYNGMSTDDAFRDLTDGEGCPVSRAWAPESFLRIASEAGFSGRHTGNAISSFEMENQLRRFAAIVDPRLEREHREFLRDIRLDPEGFPRNAAGDVAGVDACFELWTAE